MPRMGKAIGVFAATLAAATLVTGEVRAEAPPSVGGGVDWLKLVTELDGLARGKKGAEMNLRTPPMPGDARSSQLVVQNSGNAWFGVAPRMTLVARDWGGAFRLAGDRLSLVDAIRLSASTRMVMSRVRMASAGSARLVPFFQMGAGQWRTDPNLLPLTPRDTEIAAQVGTGVEITLSPIWQIACETSATMLLRDGRTDNAIPQTRMWSTSIASRLTF
jgi:hypothetical protein